MEKMLNFRCNWRHVSLEYQIKRYDPSQDLSRSAVLVREIQAAEKVKDWKSVRDRIGEVERIKDAPNITNFQAKYNEESARILEKVREKILEDLPELQILQTRYLVLLLQINYLEELKKAALAVRSELQSESVEAPELVKLLVEMILLDKDSEVLQTIRDLLVDWKKRR